LSERILGPAEAELEWRFRLAAEPKEAHVKATSRPLSIQMTESISLRASHDPVHRAGLVVLAFHRVVHRPERDHDIGWADFRALLDELDASRLTVSLEADPSTLTDVHIALTFDDATDDHFEVALELDRRHMKGIFFVPPGRLDTPSFLDASQLRSIDGQGHVVGAHGLNHMPLPELSTEDRLREVRDSKRMLEDLLGHPVDLFAPPGGAYVPSLPAELAEHGYVAARSMIWGTYESVDERWHIPCVPVTSFILRRGWATRTMETGRMPAPMRWTWRAKEILPLGLRIFVRGAIHGTKGNLSKRRHPPSDR
jgi:peptidoglycan/xylan/chitin deacetylase (PgdA/CDA1 family)